MIVELVGLPGSGKSTLTNAVKTEGRNQGIDFTLPYGSDIETQLISGAPRYVKRHKHRRLLFSSIAFASNHPGLMECVKANNSSNAMTEEFLFLLNGSLYQNASEATQGITLFDESFIQRGVNLFMNKDRLADYLKLVPVSDLVIHLKVDPDVAFQRCIDRHPNVKRVESKVISKFGDKDRFLHRAELNQLSAGLLSERGAEVMELDGTAPVEELAQKVVRACAN